MSRRPNFLYQLTAAIAINSSIDRRDLPRGHDLNVLGLRAEQFKTYRR